ncbi:telomerase inhibitor [Exophiala xenobiotica]|uniref:Telomerase inhibitor n=1 Tax=Vermiconidia calcicola TaxID=1690605 RepID=A0AAV9QHC0_9PEZI|nr:telomerase inhibitor [Exophiala xenobiotica]KAK5541949.1 telomerase inhibitor [Vermiconidia calcicola]KAK5543064.1 telomerase inhibitor [Chaetothyriales sp. CCFEE 6169]KAK5273326.1 telomerase inhibitor [Exophiala xenobiotica]KAK5307025.1 telomerase inhibitor [Exophiala xenobiotica]
MGLAEPKRRLKMSHDPRNLSWSQSSTSFGQRMMTQQGWKEGQSLGNRESIHLGLNDTDRLAAARVGILFKDDNLGLGAKSKSKDVEGQRIGLDAFQGLLGRLNGKSDADLHKEEKKVEDRKLAMYARGRWGGMVFVRGGILVGSMKEDDEQDKSQSEVGSERDETDEKGKRKEEKRQRKEERRQRREEKALRKAATKAKKATKDHNSPLSQPPDEPVSSSPSDDEAPTTSKQKRRRSSTSQVDSPVSKPQIVSSIRTQNGRHLLRGRNIQAKRMAFSDTKGLDEIFMRPAK